MFDGSVYPKLRCRHVNIYRATVLQVQKKLAERFCTAVKPHMASVLQEWASSGAGESLDARSSELLQAWGATRTFEKRLMSSLEGIVGAGGSKADRSYEDLKARAAGHLRAHQPQQEPESSVFDVRSASVIVSAGPAPTA
jgi:hypothetical protein